MLYMRLKDKVTIVTGGSRGIGEEIANKFGQHGSKVVIADINEETGLEDLEGLKKKGIEAEFIKTDVANDDSSKNFISLTVCKDGGLDILVNNAALTLRKSAEDTSFEEWQKILGVNLNGAFLCSKYGVTEMKKRESRAIVNIES